MFSGFRLASAACRIGILGALIASGASNAIAQSITFSQPKAAPWAGLTNVVADLDRDGRLDIVSRIDYGPGWTSVAWNIGNGTYSTYRLGEVPPNDAVTLADVDGDGYPDLIAVDRGLNSIYIMRNGMAAGCGHDFCTMQVIDRATYSGGTNESAYRVAAGDVDGDGDIDLVVSSYRGDQRFHVLINDGYGTFSMGWSSPVIGGEEATVLRLADINQDGFPDLIAGGHNRGANVWVNDGYGNFSPAFSFNSSPFGWWWGATQNEMVVADVNGDGYPDILASESWCDPNAAYNDCTQYGSRVVWYQNTGNPNSFVRHDAVKGWTYNQSGAVIDPGVSPMSGWGGNAEFGGIAAADLDGDGYPELVVVPLNGAPLAFMNDRTGSFSLAWQSPATRTDGTGVVMSSIYLDDLDGNGIPNLFGGGYYGGVSFGNASSGGPKTCTPGSYLAAPTDTDCTLAPAGYYVADAGATSATPCPAGYFSGMAGATSCQPARPGTYVPASGSGIYLSCNYGYYQPNAASTACLAAPAGMYVGTYEAIAATACPLGKYQPNTGQAACVPAPPGNYVPATGATDFIPCAPGSYQPASGAWACNLAPAGSYIPVAGAISGPAPLCPLGTYQPSTGQASCLQAPAGAYVGVTRSTSYSLCPIGAYQPAAGAAACIPAPAGSYVPTIGATAATACPSGYTSVAGAAACTPLVQPPPSFAGTPGPVTAEATSGAGAVVTYAPPTATSYSGSPLPVSCSPAPGTTFPIGTTTVRCSATDGAGRASLVSFTITVRDTAKPSVSASFVPLRSGGDDESAQFFRISFSATDAVGVTSLSAVLNGIPVTNGQIVQLKTMIKGDQKSKREDGNIQIQASAFQLTVTAKDAAGNAGTATATPVFNKNGKDDDDKKGGKGGDR